MDGSGAELPAESASYSAADPLFASHLSAERLELLGRYGEIRPTEAGQVLYREGDRSLDFIVLLSGSVNISDHQAGVERELATRGPGDFVAELSILTGERLFTTAVVREPGSVLVVPVDRLRALIERDQALAEAILETALRRRRFLWQVRAGMRIIGRRTSPDIQRLREFADRNRLPHVWIDVEADPAAALVLGRHGLCPEDTPIVVMRGGEVLRNPSNTELARAAGFGSGPPARKTYDVAVVGAGPAGMAASVYSASEGLATVTLDGLGVGGQIGTTSRIENYLGFPVGVSGAEFAERAFIQALRFGVTLLVPGTATGLSGHPDGYVIRLDTGDELAARSLVIATGVTYRRLDTAGLDQFDGTGVFYTPLAAQDEVYPGDPVVIVGGGNSAGQAAISLADHRCRVTVVVRGDDLAASMSQYLVDRITARREIEVLCRSVVQQVSGAGRLERVVVEELSTATRQTLTASALFVLIGAEPHTQWLAGSIELDDRGFIVTGPDLSGHARRRDDWQRLSRDPYLLETTLPGVFAAGDVRSGSVKRVASAVGEGSIAVRFISEHLGRSSGLAATRLAAR